MSWVIWLLTPCLLVAANSPVTVHVIPHTHDDVGWLKTVDQYYYGSKDHFAAAGVQYILDTVVEELMADANKTFIYVEVAFFKRWWEEQTNLMKTNVRQLVKNKQLEFINGGYCMNDEASVHYIATIDQMSFGLRWLHDEFGEDAAPTIAWQIDPFGHSSAHTALSRQMGLKGLFFARMHYQDYNKRKREQNLEFMWNNEAEKTSMFTGVMLDMYWAPPTFCFDTNCQDSPVVTNPDSPEYNLPERADALVNYMMNESLAYRSGNIMLTMGGDFCYQNAHKNFKNMDALFDYINGNSDRYGFNMIYSTPSRYMDAVLKGIGKMVNKTDDLFPYADSPHSYWTGYFTSRPGLKKHARDANNLLQTCKQVEAITGVNAKGSTSMKLQLALGVAQHHDAVSGTSKQHVADDYSQRLAIGETECEAVIVSALQKLRKSSNKFEMCRLLNETSCGVIYRNLNSTTFTLVVYNYQMYPAKKIIRIPLASPRYILADVSSKKAVATQFVESNNSGELKIEMVFVADLPGLGYKTYQLTKTDGDMYFFPRKLLFNLQQGEDVRLESKYYVVTFDRISGSIKRITNKLAGLSGKTNQLDVNLMQYTSSIGTPDDSQASGAYIFRPNGTANKIGPPRLTNYVPGFIVSEIWQKFSEWASLVYRVYYDSEYVEIEWNVGPIPEDHGREVIVRYDSDLKTKNLFYTDSNGREMVQRKLNFQPSWHLNQTEPVAGNYYPVNTRISLKDEDSKMHMTVLTDRSQGGASLSDGQMELMVHRRLFHDDHRGVDEALNETEDGIGLFVKGRHWLYYSDMLSYGMHRTIGRDLFYQPIIGISAEYDSGEAADSFVNTTLLATPQKIRLITLETWNSTAWLMRLENITPLDEGGSTGSIDLSNLFVNKKLLGLEELALGADRSVGSSNNDFVDKDSKFSVSLSPLQIRTFILTFA